MLSTQYECFATVWTIIGTLFFKKSSYSLINVVDCKSLKSRIANELCSMFIHDFSPHDFPKKQFTICFWADRNFSAIGGYAVKIFIEFLISDFYNCLTNKCFYPDNRRMLSHHIQNNTIKSGPFQGNHPQKKTGFFSSTMHCIYILKIIAAKFKYS